MSIKIPAEEKKSFYASIDPVDHLNDAPGPPIYDSEATILALENFLASQIKRSFSGQIIHLSENFGVIRFVVLKNPCWAFFSLQNCYITSTKRFTHGTMLELPQNVSFEAKYFSQESGQRNYVATCVWLKSKPKKPNCVGYCDLLKPISKVSSLPLEVANHKTKQINTNTIQSSETESTTNEQPQEEEAVRLDKLDCHIAGPHRMKSSWLHLPNGEKVSVSDEQLHSSISLVLENQNTKTYGGRIQFLCEEPANEGIIAFVFEKKSCLTYFHYENVYEKKTERLKQSTKLHVGRVVHFEAKFMFESLEKLYFVATCVWLKPKKPKNPVPATVDSYARVASLLTRFEESADKAFVAIAGSNERNKFQNSVPCLSESRDPSIFDGGGDADTKFELDFAESTFELSEYKTSNTKYEAEDGLCSSGNERINTVDESESSRTSLSLSKSKMSDSARSAPSCSDLPDKDEENPDKFRYMLHNEDDDSQSGPDFQSLFETRLGHLLSTKETMCKQDRFLPLLKSKRVFKSVNNGFPKNLEQPLWSPGSVCKMKDKTEEFSQYLTSLGFNDKPGESSNRYLISVRGTVVVASETHNLGLIESPDGFVVFSFEDWFDPEQDGQTRRPPDTKTMVNSCVSFDALTGRTGIWKFEATCVWTVKRPLVETLRRSIALHGNGLDKHQVYFGKVMRLDLPSNAIILLSGLETAVIATRSIFDYKRSTVIADYLHVGQEVKVRMEDESSCYAKHVVRCVSDSVLKGCDVVEGAGIITGYSHDMGVLEFREDDQLKTALFIRDLALVNINEDDRCLPVGSAVSFQGVLRCEEPFVVATSLSTLPKLTTDMRNTLSCSSGSAFRSGKIYSGIVTEIRPPYAFIVECTHNEQNVPVFVFVSSRKFRPKRSANRLSYADQIQFFVGLGDKVRFTASKCSTLAGLHPYEWDADAAWKEGIIKELKCLENVVRIEQDSGTSASCDSQGHLRDFTKENSCSGLHFENTQNGHFLENAENAENAENDGYFSLDDIIRNCLLLKTDLSHEVVDGIVRNIHTRIVSDYKVNEVMDYVRALFNSEGAYCLSKKTTKNQQTQTASTGRVIYVNVFPSIMN